MDNGGLSASDVALMTGANNGWGGDGWGSSMMWIFALLILAGGGFGNGFGWGGNGGNLDQDINRGFDNQNLQAQTRDILNAVTNGTAQAINATNQTFHDTLAVFNDKYGELVRDIGNVQLAQANALANQNECCCNTLRAIDNVNYQQALNTASINENTTAQTQKILDAITGNRMADMQNQINQLQLQNAMNGVVRYPNSTVYSSGCNPFCGCGCGN